MPAFPISLPPHSPPRRPPEEQKANYPLDRQYQSAGNIGLLAQRSVMPRCLCDCYIAIIVVARWQIEIILVRRRGCNRSCKSLKASRRLCHHGSCAIAKSFLSLSISTQFINSPHSSSKREALSLASRNLRNRCSLKNWLRRARWLLRMSNCCWALSCRCRQT